MCDDSIVRACYRVSRMNDGPREERHRPSPWRVARCSPLVEAFSEDRFLSIGTAVACVGALVPIFLSPFLPLQDLPNHTALASLLSHMANGGEVSSLHFMPQPYPVPYWVGYMVIFVGGKLASPLFGAKLLVALAVLAVPLGLMRLLISLDRSPRLGLWAFALAWDYNMSWGFVAFNLATGLSFIYIAWAIDSLELPSLGWGRVVMALALGLVLALTHAHATGVAVLALGVLALGALPRRSDASRLLLFACAPVLGLLPWLAMGFATGGDSVAVPEDLAGFGSSANAGKRMTDLFRCTLGFVRGQVPEGLMGVAFVILLVFPLLYLAPSRPSGASWRRSLGLYLLAWALYLVLPTALYWPFEQLFIQQRHATLILLLGLTLPTCDFSDRHAWRLIPGLVAVALSIGVSAWSSHSFAKHAEPFLEITEAVPMETRVLPVILSDRVPESRRALLNQFSAYIVAAKGGYTPYLFDTPNLVVRYQQDRHLPHPPWYEPKKFSIEEHARHYDYVLVQGLKNDPIRKKGRHRSGPWGEVRLVEVTQAGPWRLYRVEKP